MENKYFKDDAKQIVDMLFDARMFRDDITRDLLNGVEDLMGFLLQARFDSAWRAKELFEKIK